MRRPTISNLDGLPDETILDVADVAAILNCSTQTATRQFWSNAKAGQMISTGKIARGFRLGARLKITAGDLRAGIESLRILDDNEIATQLEAESRSRSADKKRPRGA